MSYRWTMQEHPGNFIRIQGPYLRPDGRKHMIATREDGRKTTLSYPKYLMECHLGRLLAENETVDHFDKDKTNDDINNLKVIERPDHARIDAKRRVKNKANCAQCGQEFEMSRNQIEPKREFQIGPFCSRSCQGKASTALQYHGIITLSERDITITHTYVDKEDHIDLYK